MNTAVINIKTENSTKKQAQEVASRMGLSLSALINAYLKELVKIRRIEFSADELPSPYLINAIKQAKANAKKGKISPTFTNIEEAIHWLENPKAKYQNEDKI